MTEYIVKNTVLFISKIKSFKWS